MQTVTITHADQSKNGKPRVYFDGKHDWTDAFYLSPKCPDPPMGAKVEVMTHSWRPPNGKTDMWFLDDFRLCVDQPPVAEVKATVAASAQTKDSHLTYQIQEAKARFVSNLCGSALAALRLQKPEEIEMWAAAALKAVDKIFDDSAKPHKARIPGAEFDDKIPY